MKTTLLLCVMGCALALADNEHRHRHHRRHAEPAVETAHARHKQHASADAGSPLDKVNVGELSCRARNETNVGLDQLVNHYFKAGKRSFYRYELWRPTFAWSDKDLDFYEVDCTKTCNAHLASDVDLSMKKCLSCEDAVTTGNAHHVIAALYPLLGKLFQTELKKAFDKLQPKNTYEEVKKVLGDLPFEKEYFTAFSKNKKGSCTKKVVMYLLIRNQQVGLNKLVLAAGKLQRILRCSAFRKYINAEDIYTTIIDNDVFELKLPPQWINEFVVNTSHTQNLGFNQPKLQQAVTIGFLEQFMTTEGMFKPEAALTEEYNETCKQVREQMVNLWSKARKLKCGDAGYTPSAGAADPLEAKDDKDEKDGKDADKDKKQ